MSSEMLGQRWARRMPWLDSLARKVQPPVRTALRSVMPVRDALDGTWLGTPLHPAMINLPLGATTVAFALDSMESITGSQPLGVASDRVLAAGVIATVPAAATGTSDWRDLIGQERSIATLHALLNVGGLVANTCSVLARVQGRRGVGKAASAAGLLLSGVAAHIGGELSFGRGVRVNQNVWNRGPTQFTEVLDEASLHPGALQVVEVAGTRVLLTRSQSGQPCAVAARCSHAGGPLEEGQRVNDSVVCPWHGSRFDLCTGAVVNGPAVFPQPSYETRVRDGRIAIRLVDS